MRAHRTSPRAWTPVMFLVPLLIAAPAAASDPSPAPAPSPTITAGLYLSTGDEIEGWSWLRDEAGCQYATWSFFGAPGGGPVTVTFAVLATDGVGGGPGVDATAWISVGEIEAGAPGPAIFGPALTTFPNVSTPDDPVGYQTLGTVTILPEQLGPNVQGLWVLVERRGPTGEVVPVQVATNREATTVTGLIPVGGCAGSCPLAPDPSPAK